MRQQIYCTAGVSKDELKAVVSELRASGVVYYEIESSGPVPYSNYMHEGFWVKTEADYLAGRDAVNKVQRGIQAAGPPPAEDMTTIGYITIGLAVAVGLYGLWVIAKVIFT